MSNVKSTADYGYRFSFRVFTPSLSFSLFNRGIDAYLRKTTNWLSKPLVYPNIFELDVMSKSFAGIASLADCFALQTRYNSDR